MNKLLDLRFVIGVFFILVAILLLLQGFLFSGPGEGEVNRWCGIVFAIFGAFMVFLSLQKDAHDELLEEEK